MEAMELKQAPEGLRRLSASKAAEIERLLALGPPPALKGRRPSLAEALRRGREKRGIGLLAEYKRASPSLGDIDLTTSPEEAAEAFRGADCLSVLTESDYFKGELSFIERAKAFGGPILRKDFIYHPSQIAETAATSASALLLIVSLTPDLSLLSDLVSLAAASGIEAVTEIFSLSELETARKAKASIIQVNARNLGDLSVDPERALSLIKSADPAKEETFIAASGLKTYDDLRRAASLGYHGALVGTALMRAKDKRAALASLLSPPSGASSGAPFGSPPAEGPSEREAEEGEK
ncbi:MAG: indole-3-glycerol-phosphate synthase [Deltaproteobacteria bacterium]|jgi:indole-3-glycerol phosphate synthase|nr:indole-3-glycerol-phosphate synthase [Deltaproteobacteria bacterium]